MNAFHFNHTSWIYEKQSDNQLESPTKLLQYNTATKY